MSKPKFKELRKYYVRCESIMFSIRNWMIQQSQLQLEQQYKQLEESK